MATRPPRQAYHHGDLHDTLVREAVAIARADGPDAITLRAVTRSAAVSPSAAYRHFADRAALVQEVVFHGQRECALTIERRLAAGADGVERLRAVGHGYVAFAQAEPGLFAAAFLEPSTLALSLDSRAAGDSGLTPFGHLAAALDAMVDDGTLAPERRPHAEVPCWSAVHGLSMLAVRGPLREAPPETIDALTHRVVEGAILAARSL